MVGWTIHIYNYKYFNNYLFYREMNIIQFKGWGGGDILMENGKWIVDTTSLFFFSFFGPKKLLSHYLNNTLN